jgi:hypothetical protein
LTRSELVDEVVEGWDAFLETFALTGVGNDFGRLGAGFEWVTVEEFPMVEHALWESTSGSGGAESLSETEGLGDGQVSLDHHEWGSLNSFFGENNTTALGHALIDTTDGIIRSLDFDQEDWFHKSGLSSELTSIEDASSGGNDLTTTSVDSIGVQGDIFNVESDATHVLVGHNTLFSGPLEGCLHRVFDFVEILNLLGYID